MTDQGRYKMSEKEMREAGDIIGSLGMEGLKQYMETMLGAWEDVPLNLAVTGNSGTGKSTFINTMRGLKSKDEGAAKVDFNECTTEVTSYCHPKYKNFILSDLPGLGTPDFPQEEYLKKVGFEKFDFFLILCYQRFTENDVWLAREVKKHNKQYFFVRTKIDIDVKNDAEDDPREHNPDTVRERVAENCRTNFEKQGLGTSVPIFLISGRLSDIGRWDFPKLQEALISKMPDIKQEALTLSLHCNSKEIIRRKCEILWGRIWKVVGVSAAASTLDVPGVPLAIDTAVMLKEIEFCKQQLGLDERTLASLSKQTNTSLNFLATKVAFVNIETQIRLAALESTVENTFGDFHPVLKFLARSSASFLSANLVMENVLSTLEKAALEVAELKLADARAIGGLESKSGEASASQPPSAHK